MPTLRGEHGQRSRGYVYDEYFYPDPKKYGTGPLVDILKRKGTGREQQQFLRVGDFTAIRTEIKSADDPLRLYDVVHDPHEDHDLAGDPKYADQLRAIRDMLPALHRPLADAERPYDDAPIPAVPMLSKLVEKDLFVSLYPGSFPYVADLDALVPKRRWRDSLRPRPIPDDSSLKISGNLTVPADGKYTLWLTTDGGGALWMQGGHLIDDDFQHDGRPVSATVNLKSGAHPFEVFYRHVKGPEIFKLDIEGPNLPRQPIPDSMLSA